MSALTAYGACAWGFNRPGCFLWARLLPSGRVYVQSELKFVNKTEEAVAALVRQKTADLGIHRFAAIYATPEMCPTPTESQRRIVQAEAPSQVFARHGLPMIPSGSNRVHGWQRLHDYLQDAPDGRPWLLIDPSCVVLIRTLPSLVQVQSDPDDCEGEDFAANALRVLLSARPAPGALVQAKKAYAWGTVGWLREWDDADRRRARGVLTR